MSTDVAGVDEELKKLGHSPAQKIAGGVRIARKEKTCSESETDKKLAENDEEESEGGSSSKDEVAKQSGNILNSTGLTKLTQQEFPEKAVRAFHEKPQPTRDPPPPARQEYYRKDHKLNQPQRFN